MLDFAFLIHDECGAFRPVVLVAFDIVGPENSVSLEHFAVHVAQEGKGDADLLGEGGVGGGTVNTDSKNDGVAGFELGLISLIGLKFLRSTTGEGQNIESEDYVLLSAVIA